MLQTISFIFPLFFVILLLISFSIGKGGNSYCRKRQSNCCCDPRQRSFNCSEPDLRSQNRRHPVGTLVHLPGPGFKMLLEFYTITDVSHTVTDCRHTLGETSHPVGFESRTGTTASDCRSHGTPKHSANYPEHLDTYRHIPFFLQFCLTHSKRYF